MQDRGVGARDKRHGDGDRVLGCCREPKTPDYISPAVNIKIMIVQAEYYGKSRGSACSTIGGREYGISIIVLHKKT